MSRARRVLHSVGSGYVLLAATALFNLAAVPLALSYLTTEEFGLWALISQITNYLALIDLGMSSSVGLVLFDFKDRAETGEYGSVIQTGVLALAAQGVVVLVAGWALTPLLQQALAIPVVLQPAFGQLLVLQCAITAASFTTRIFSYLLVAQHRFDLVNYVQSAMTLVNFGLTWWFFSLGWKLVSLPVAGAVCLALSSALMIKACGTLRVYPPKGAWGRPSWQRFKALLLLGKDMFLVMLGAQFILASQTLLVTRTMGLHAAGVWSVCTKTYSLVSQLVWRIYDFSTSAFAEIIVRQERERLFDRFRSVVTFTASLSGVVAVLFAVANEPFIAVWTGWTSDQVGWSQVNNVLLGVWLVIVSVLRCHSGLVLLTKRVGFLRYMYFVEGLIFLALANLLVRRGGFPAMLLVSIVCSLTFTWAYAVWRTARYFSLPWREVAWNWVTPMFRLLLGLVPLAVAVRWLARHLPPAWQLVVCGLLVGGPACYLLLRVGLSRAMQQEILQRAPTPWGPLLRRVLPASRT